MKPKYCPVLLVLVSGGRPLLNVCSSAHIASVVDPTPSQNSPRFTSGVQRVGWPIRVEAVHGALQAANLLPPPSAAPSSAQPGARSLRLCQRTDPWIPGRSATVQPARPTRRVGLAARLLDGDRKLAALLRVEDVAGQSYSRNTSFTSETIQLIVCTGRLHPARIRTAAPHPPRMRLRHLLAAPSAHHISLIRKPLNCLHSGNRPTDPAGPVAPKACDPYTGKPSG